MTIMTYGATPTLNPYDTGSRLEPKLWQPDRGSVIAAMSAGEHEDVGKVDFEDDEGGAAVVVFMSRDADGGYVLNIQPLCGNNELTVRVHDETEVR